MKIVHLGIAIALMASAAFARANEASADSSIGFVKTTQGDAFVVRAGEASPAVAGAPLVLGDTLKTGTRASLGVTFNDNTIMSLGPETTIVIDEYLFAPGKGELKLGASLRQGTLNYVSGLIAKLRPEAVNLKTPTGTIGVRGTHFVAKVEPAK